MTERARIGVIGVGQIGEAHIKALTTSGKAEVVAIADLDERLLQSRRSTYGIPATYVDVAEMLEHEKLDGVVVATPDEHHRAPVEAVAAAGIPLLLEKP